MATTAPAAPTTKTSTPTGHVANPLRDRILDLAADIGRLTRRLEPDTYLAHIADRLHRHCEVLYLLATPSAGELAATTAPGDEWAVEEAIRIVDEGWVGLQRLLEVRA